MKWISIKKKVPEKNQLVLAIEKPHPYTNQREIYLCKFDGTFYKIVPSFYFDLETPDIEITHWIPIPKIPEIK